nr:CocE/NonD family hydrolase [Nocardia bovistercoris]
MLTDRWYSSDGADPIVLIRSPYGRGMVASYARLLAERGFTVIVQSCRGTFGSGGVFDPMFGEVEDTRATWEWMDAQPWAHEQVVPEVSSRQRSPRPLWAGPRCSRPTRA